ncbi:MAG: flagellar hook-associated protein FlgK [Methylotenera sp.]|nr:flagellar hook-associated protein FlgK [Methylotenera sp.]MDO9232123.1 flagellar hook-associated protein FlgK [Methylotenera sp.]MDO9389608.1 flagellar hook-associated protein FlgK [Methylotenera sp.]MDP2102907.1 flagellar hook-associated protein FlgK [Methylotenera sp.]MDP2280830.1 flagellar hook-associated protein FlgK [Methylotenera sp.]
MASNILSIGKSALAAAQVGISTTGHNIANASTPGYSRQVVVQAAAQSQNFGYGYVGQGTEISGVNRVYNDILAAQVVRSQATSTGINTYQTQMSTINDMLSNPAAGLNPAMSDFFGSMQDLSANPSDTATRQSMLSYTQSLANRFQSTNNRLNEIRDGVNAQLTSSIGLVNVYAKQIASLNDTIEKAVSANGNTPNDLLDQRDQLVLELSKQIKTTVVPQGQGSYNIYIGNGMPLVVGKDTFSLVPAASPTDPSRVEVAYLTSGKTTVLGTNSLPGGAIGGLLQFRAESLDTIQNQIGQLATVLAETFNAQHSQGLDKNGNPGGPLFSIPNPTVNANSNNSSPSPVPPLTNVNATPAVVSSKVEDARALTASDYRLEYDGTNYKITRLSDMSASPPFSSLPQTVDGVSFKIDSGSMLAGDNFLIKPTQNAAALFKVAITNPDKLAVGGPALTSSEGVSNAGTGTITAPIAGSGYAASPLSAPFTMTYNTLPSAGLSFTPSQAVVVTSGATSTTYAPGDLVPYTSGATITTANTSFTLSGTLSNGDNFTVAANTAGAPGDNRNGLLLAGLQSEKTLNGGKNSYSDAFGQLVNGVGNKTRELNVLSISEAQVLEQVTAAVQSESGVNLDEEATNLIRYQQAYQAAGKMMQIASQLFDVLLRLGN